MRQEKHGRRTDGDSDTRQVSDQEAGAWKIPYSRAEFEPGIDTDSVGEMEAEDGKRRRRDRED